MVSGDRAGVAPAHTTWAKSATKNSVGLMIAVNSKSAIRYEFPLWLKSAKVDFRRNQLAPVVLGEDQIFRIGEGGVFRRLRVLNTSFSSGTAGLSGWFFSEVQSLLAALHRDESETIARAAQLLAGQIRDDRLIHVFGVGGHSVIGCEEFFCRAGGLACINPMFEASLLLSSGGMKSTMIERVPGVGDKIVRSHAPEAGEVLIITSIYGMNAATIDAALEAKRLGLKVIAITSRDHASKTPADFVARHPSRKNLFDIADLTIDNHVPHGDAIVPGEGSGQKIGATSTILVSACVQWLCMETVRACEAMGVPAPVWQSANTVGGDERNAGYIRKYGGRVRCL